MGISQKAIDIASMNLEKELYQIGLDEEKI